MRIHRGVLATAGLALLLAATPSPSSTPLSAWSWQGRGQGQGQGQGQAKSRGQGQGRGQARGQQRGRPPGQARAEARAQERRSEPSPAPAARDRGRSDEAPGRAVARGNGRGRPDREEVRARVVTLPAPFRGLSSSARRGDRLALAAITLGSFHGLTPAVLRLRTEGDRVLIRDDDDRLLLDLDEARARDLGAWQMRRLGDRRARSDGPAFCRSGEGHPVWGREWCLDKGFGLGSAPGRLWTRGAVDDVVFHRVVERDDDLDWDDLLGVLGAVAMDRLALQSLSLGYGAPLTGVWVAEPAAPRILRVRAGNDVVAELIDVDRDDRVEMMYVLALD